MIWEEYVNRVGLECRICKKKHQPILYLASGKSDQGVHTNKLNHICMKEFGRSVRRLCICKNCTEGTQTVEELVLSYDGIMTRNECLSLIEPNYVKDINGDPVKPICETKRYFIAEFNLSILLIIEKETNKILHKGKPRYISTLWFKRYRGKNISLHII